MQFRAPVRDKAIYSLGFTGLEITVAVHDEKNPQFLTVLATGVDKGTGQQPVPVPDTCLCQVVLKLARRAAAVRCAPEISGIGMPPVAPPSAPWRCQSRAPNSSTGPAIRRAKFPLATTPAAAEIGSINLP
jgi:hypothetical protein